MNNVEPFKVLIWPDPALRVVARPVENFDSDLSLTVQKLAATLYKNKGAGLAATQVGLDVRVFVMDCSSNPLARDLTVFVNPVITDKSPEIAQCDEGCLSFPGVNEYVARHVWIRGHAFDVLGIKFEFMYTGLKSQCVQHELEHLDGKVMLDHFNRTQRRAAEKTLRSRR